MSTNTQGALQKRPANRTASIDNLTRWIWIPVTIDLFFFLLYFLAFIINRSLHSVAFETARRQVDPTLGFVNTLILLTSSLFVFLAVDSSRQTDNNSTKRHLLIATILGLSFVCLKIIGYAHDATQGHNAIINGFFGFFGYYYVLTGIHLLHVLLGIAGLIYCWLIQKEPAHSKQAEWVEAVAVFWHMVDIVWIILFPMFFLLKHDF